MNQIKEIAELLIGIVPDGWKRIILRGIILPGSYEFEYYFENSEGELVQYYELIKDGVFTDRDIHDVFRKMRKLSNSMLENVDEKWKSYILAVDKKYHFTVDYDYDEPKIGNEWIDNYK